MNTQKQDSQRCSLPARRPNWSSSAETLQSSRSLADLDSDQRPSQGANQAGYGPDVSEVGWCCTTLRMLRARKITGASIIVPSSAITFQDHAVDARICELPLRVAQLCPRPGFGSGGNRVLQVQNDRIGSQADGAGQMPPGPDRHEQQRLPVRYRDHPCIPSCRSPNSAQRLSVCAPRAGTSRPVTVASLNRTPRPIISTGPVGLARVIWRACG